ncbi:MAG TPA: metal-sulfur cluster assembly factor [Candidatus Eremiobacteraceae bacterium]|nr:metal-sulfur cluster assembly factor [Candidatus Eremiobacteraceae bacterium]
MNPEQTPATQPTTQTADATSQAAAPASAAAAPLIEERVREELKTVVDPEIGIDMVSLGLIYGVRIEGTTVYVTMTLTSPGCPVAGMFLNAVHAALMSIPGVTEAKVDLTFAPPWDPRTMASEEAKMMMGIYY